MEVPLAEGVSIVVPVYNSSGSLPLLLERLTPVLEGLGEPFEVVLVNDGSRDASFDTIRQLQERYTFVRGADLMRNYGQHNALLCGIRLARFTRTVTIDDDLQNPPEEIPRLLAKLEEGYDVVYGAVEQEQHGFFRDCASRVTKMVLATAMGVGTARRVSAFRVFHTHLRRAFASYAGPFVSIDVLLTWGASRFTHIFAQHDARTIGTSNYTLRMLVTHAMNMLTGFSTLPLQIASILGFVMTIFGLLILVFVILMFLIRGTPVPGFPFLASIIAVFSGSQLFALGIIGEYLARMHFRIMDRPNYVTRELCEGRD